MIDETLDRLIDRLVDDELNSADRRQLLSRLDSEPDGWRRCALAFLEAQCWRGSLAPLAGTRTVEEAGSTPSKSIRISRRSWATRMAMAACLLLAFALGWASAPGSPNVGPNDDATASGALPIAKPTDRATIADRDRGSANQDEHPLNVSAAPRAIGVSAPVASSATLSAASPDRLRRQLERQGYAIETQRPLTALVKLRDGRRVAVPVEQVKFHYVGNRSL